MLLIKDNDTLNIDSGFNSYEINSDTDINLNLNLKNDCDLFIRINKVKNLNINASISGKSSIVFWNDSNDSINAIENYDVINDGDLTLAYGECNDGITKRKLDVNLKDKNTNALVASASLVSNKKNYQIYVINENLKTSGNIKNFAVILENGDLMIDAVGKIVKGAKRSKSHQVSRALSFKENQKATILPELLIDENDVEASHAMSIGRVDEKHLYYMMSRGLNINDCTKLISLGYLLPITEYINNEELSNTLKEELERKIVSNV